MAIAMLRRQRRADLRYRAIARNEVFSGDKDRKVGSPKPSEKRYLAPESLWFSCGIISVHHQEIMMEVSRIVTL